MFLHWLNLSHKNAKRQVIFLLIFSQHVHTTTPEQSILNSDRFSVNEGLKATQETVSSSTSSIFQNTRSYAFRINPKMQLSDNVPHTVALGSGVEVIKQLPVSRWPKKKKEHWVLYVTWLNSSTPTAPLQVSVFVWAGLCVCVCKQPALRWDLWCNYKASIHLLLRASKNKPL